MDRLLAPAQDHRVATLHAKRGSVDRHVGPALVDHEDDAQGNSHLTHVEPVTPAVRPNDLTDGVVQRDDFQERSGDLVDPPRIKLQSIDGRGG